MILLTSTWGCLLKDWIRKENINNEVVETQLSLWKTMGKIPLNEWISLAEKTREIHKISAAAGIEIGSCISPYHTGILGYLATFCDSVEKAITYYVKYEKLFQTDVCASFFVDEEKGEVELSWPGKLTNLLYEECSASALITFINNYLDYPLQLSSIDFSFHGSTEAKSICERFFSCEINYNSPRYALRTKIEEIRRPLSSSDINLLYYLEKQAMYIMQQQPSVSFLDTLRIRIKDLLKNGDINLDKLCQEISLSPRTLQRRLNAYNTNWKDLVDQVRSELANDYIKDPSISFTKLTSLLGYSEQSSFNRAFYRWFKKTPSEYRVSIR